MPRDKGFMTTADSRNSSRISSLSASLPTEAADDRRT